MCNYEIKESLNKSRLTAQHLSCLPFFRHLVQKSLDNRQVACGLFAQSDEKIADAIQALNLISASLIPEKIRYNNLRRMKN